MNLGTFIVVVLGTIFATFALGDFDARERQVGWVSFAAHLAASLVFWLLNVYFFEGADPEMFRSFGADLAKLLDLDLARFGPEVLRLALHLETHLPFDVTGNGSSTGTMSAVSGFLAYVFGPSLLTQGILVGAGAWFGQLCLYRVARRELAPEDRRPALLGLLLVPSVIFWGSGFVKEAIVMACFGPLVLSSYLLVRSRNPLYLVGIAVGGTGVGMLKAYTLLAYVIAIAGFFYSDRALRAGGPVRVRPMYLLLAGAIAVGGVIAMGKLFPQYEVTSMPEALANTQQTWTAAESHGIGSEIAVLGNAEARSVSQQLAFVPMAFVNALLRPSVFDVRNGTSFVAAVENTLIFLSFFALFRATTRRGLLDGLLRTPLLASGLVFVLVFACGIGLTTSNLGSISRYRAPMMPFYVTILLVLRERLRRTSVVPRVALMVSRRLPAARGRRAAQS